MGDTSIRYWNEQNQAAAKSGDTRRLKTIACAGLALTAAMTGIVWASDKPRLKAGAVQAVAVTARSLPSFKKGGGEQTQFGKLIWRGGLELKSPSRHFGGWSGLRISRDGKKVLAVSDAGTWLRGELTYTNGRPTALTKAALGPIRALSGNPLRRTRDRDAEALSILSGSVRKGRALIAFEQNDRIGVFPILNGEVKKPSRYLMLPSAVRNKSGRNGLEALSVVRGGRYKGALFFFLEETKNARGEHRGWLMHKGRAKEVWLKDIGGFAITDCVGLADGSVIVLERRFRWSEGVRMRLRRLPGSKIKPGARLIGETLLEADMGFEIDNMEGLAAHTDKKGSTILTLISDNNFNTFLQRTVLLQFALPTDQRQRNVSRK